VEIILDTTPGERNSFVPNRPAWAEDLAHLKATLKNLFHDPATFSPQGADPSSLAERDLCGFRKRGVRLALLDELIGEAAGCAGRS